MEEAITEVVIEFYPADEDTITAFNEHFNEDETMRSSGFDGTIVLTLIAASLPVIQKAFKFYEAQQKTIRSAKIRIKEKEATLEGYSAAELNDMAEKGTIEKLRKLVK